MEFTFKNRKDELTLLAKFISYAETAGRLAIAVVYGTEGVGKSKLIEKAMDEYVDSDAVKVSVSFNPFRQYESGAYLKKIASSISAAQENNEDATTIEKFLIRESTKPLLERVAKSVGLDLARFIPGLSGAASAIEVTATDIANLKKTIFGAANLEITDLAVSYIEYVSQNSQIFVHVKNFQNVDSVSIDTIEDSLTKLSRVVFLLEWRDGDDLFYEKSNFSKRLQYFVEAPCGIKIQKLPIEELYDQITKRPDILFGIVASAYGKSDGNLRDLEKFLHNKNSFSDQISFEQENIAVLRKLRRGSLINLILIALCGENTTFDQLQEITQEATSDVRSLLTFSNSSELSQLTVEKDGCISLDHDSTLRRVLQTPEFDFERQYAANLLIRWIQKKYGNIEEFSSPLLLEFLHCCSIAHNLEGVENVLVTIEKRFSEQRCPVELISEILAYAKKITDIKLDAHKNLLIKITKILSKHSLLSDAVFITQSLAGEESSIIYYHITALLSTFQLISADHWLTILETQTSNNDRDIDREYAHERILIRLLRIWYYRLCGDMTRARRLYDSIEPDMISDKVIRVMYLRYCEIAGSKDAINQLEKALSLSVTLENGCLTQEINLALSMYYGENGDTDKALNLIKEVEEKGVLCGFIIRYASENNFVVTKILKRQAVELRTLREYRKVVLDPFDRLIIDNNLMIAEALSGKINVALLHSAKIAGMTESGNSIEPNIKKISYLNISYVHLMADEPQEAEAYWEAARRIESSVDAEHWSNLFSYGNIHECYAHNRDFFFPPFMTNWNISTDIFLSQH